MAANDLVGNGRIDIVTGAGAGGGPNVRVFDGSAQLLASFFAFDPDFTGGVTVATGRVRGIGFASIICGAGAGGGPVVSTFQTPSIHDPGGMSTDNGMLSFSSIGSFFAYDPSFTGGVQVGSLNQTLGTNYLAGAGPGGGPQVAIFDGVTHAETEAFFALASDFAGGLSVAAN